VSPQRRLALAVLAASTWPGHGRAQARDDDVPRRGRVLRFPRDHGAHLGARTEWWYLTGWLGTPEQPTGGFQVTFFRSRTGLAQGHPSRFAARHLLFAHAAITELATGREAAVHLHDQRIVRWNGDPAEPLAAAALDSARVHIGDWTLQRAEGAGAAGLGRWTSRIAAREFSLAFTLDATQPLLLQGEAGFSRKGPDEAQSSHYVSEPQLAATVQARVRGHNRPSATGRAWMDHEWSESLLHPQAVGWDWIGINLFDGGALTAFQLRRADGSALWAGGSHRGGSGPARAFGESEVRFGRGRLWRSPATGVAWPVQWQVQTPTGAFEVRALADAQELDSRASTGTLYWEGLAELRDASGRRVGLGYLELTGYGGALRL
jgi:predicted secreted hydrolase